MLNDAAARFIKQRHNWVRNCCIFSIWGISIHRLCSSFGFLESRELEQVFYRHSKLKMCTNVYIGANTTCIEIPVRYDGDIFVIALSTDRCSVPTEPILGLTTTYQYFTGVEGCGCGFAFYEREDRGVCIVYDKSHKALAKYVASCLKHVPFVELFSC